MAIQVPASAPTRRTRSSGYSTTSSRRTTARIATALHPTIQNVRAACRNSSVANGGGASEARSSQPRVAGARPVAWMFWLSLGRAFPYRTGSLVRLAAASAANHTGKHGAIGSSMCIDRHTTPAAPAGVRTSIG